MMGRTVVPPTEIKYIASTVWGTGTAGDSRINSV